MVKTRSGFETARKFIQNENLNNNSDSDHSDSSDNNNKEMIENNQISIPLGNLNFDIINIDSKAIALALKDFLKIGSTQHAISKKDIKIIRRTGTSTAGFDNVADAIAAGTRLFDAILYFSLPSDERPLISISALGIGQSDPTILEIGKALFYIYMFLLIRAKCPLLNESANQIKVPQILISSFGLNKSPIEYVKMIASFELAHLDPTWIKSIDTSNLSPISVNRLAIGIAGYRNAAIFNAFPPKSDASPESIMAAEGIRALVAKGPLWDVHPLTRSPAFLSLVRNFNKNLANLALAYFSSENLTLLLNNKMLFVIPVEQIGFNEWRSWNPNTFNQFNDRIFRNT